MGVPERRGGRTEIGTVADVEVLVRRFYQAVIPDPLLGPIFHDFGVDWSAHIPKLVDLWAGRLLGTGATTATRCARTSRSSTASRSGTAELARWLELWEETVDELFIGEIAELAKERARLAVGAIVTLVRRDTADLEPVSCGGRAG